MDACCGIYEPALPSKGLKAEPIAWLCGRRFPSVDPDPDATLRRSLPPESGDEAFTSKSGPDTGAGPVAPVNVGVMSPIVAEDDALPTVAPTARAAEGDAPIGAGRPTGPGPELRADGNGSRPALVGLGSGGKAVPLTPPGPCAPFGVISGSAG